MSYREYNKKYENLFEFIEGDEFNKWRHNIGHNTGHREDEPFRFFYLIGWFLCRTSIEIEWKENSTLKWCEGETDDSFPGIFPKRQI